MISIILHILFIIIIVICSVLSIYAFVIGAPIVFSPKKALRQTLKYLDFEPGMKFCDLGAGTGRAMIIAQKEFGYQVVGYELSPPLFVLAKINMLFHGIKNKMHMKNFYSQDLGEVDVVFCFLTSPAMEKLRPKFEHELKKNTVVISYSFSIKGWEPEKIIADGTPGKTFIYRK